MWTVLTRAALALLALSGRLLAIGFVYERLMAAGDARSFPAFGRLLSVDGYIMHLNCTGEGSPTAHLSSRGDVETVTRSGHYIQLDRPDALIQSIEAMLVATR
jgi:hypothetical protein